MPLLETFRQGGTGDPAPLAVTVQIVGALGDAHVCLHAGEMAALCGRPGEPPATVRRQGLRGRVKREG